MNDLLRKIVTERPRVLVGLPNSNEVQRFILSGALRELARDHELFYVVPTSESAKLRAAAPDVLVAGRTFDVTITPERFATWSSLFSMACVGLAHLSPSFAIRAGVSGTGARSAIALAATSTGARAVHWTTSRLLRVPWVRGGLRERTQIVHRRAKVAAASRQRLSSVLPGRYQREVRQVLGQIEPHRELVDLIEHIAPLFVLMPTSLLDLLCNDVLLACERETIACVVLQSGWDNLSSKGIIHHKPTDILVWGPQSARHAVDIQGIDPNSVRCVGAPHYEALVPAPPGARADFRRSIGVGAGTRLILFGGSFRQFDETSTLRRLDEAIERGVFGPVTILYRPHPWRLDRKHEDSFFEHAWKHVVFDPDMEDRYRRARREPGYLKRETPMYSMDYLALLLSSVDAVISPMSTLLIESVIMNRPTMAVAFGDGVHANNPSVTSRMTHFQGLAGSRALRWCDDSDRFEAMCLELLDDVDRGIDAAARNVLLDDIVTRSPGTYAQRLSELCRDVIAPRAHRLQQKRAGKKRGTISHAYGAQLIMKTYCGLEHQDPTIPDYWMHGWIPEYHNVHPALIALHKKEGQSERHDYMAQIESEKESVWQWVARRDQERYLASQRYRKVRAIGLPITYLPKPEVERQPGSLLVMPPHGHRCRGKGDPVARDYAALIASMRGEFSVICVCLSADDFARGQWLSVFRKHGIECFAGSSQADPLTLPRLARILSSFEYVTTNGFGSHIAYAAYFGAKVSVFGPYAEFPRERMARSHAVRMFPNLLDRALEVVSEKALRQHYPFLFCDPREAQPMVEWAGRELGEDQRLPPAEIMDLFGWTADRAAAA